MLERKSDKGDNRETFDKYLKDHIKTSNDTINIRGSVGNSNPNFGSNADGDLKIVGKSQKLPANSLFFLGTLNYRQFKRWPNSTEN